MNRRADVLALGSFVVLGLPDGMLGTAWPSIRATFGVPVGDLGLVLLLGTAGSVLVTVFVGTLIQRLGVPALLTVAGSCAAVGVTGCRPRGRRRAVGGELLPRASEPVHGRDGPGHVRLLGALTAVRISLALVPRPLPPLTVVHFGTALAVIAAAVIWWQPGPVGTVIAFAVLGGALAGVFPALITLTPGRIGERRAQHVIAWQVGAAAAGGAGVSALIGLLIGATSLAVLGPALTTLAVLVVASELILARLAPVPAPGPGPTARRPSAALDRVPGQLGYVR